MPKVSNFQILVQLHKVTKKLMEMPHIGFKCGGKSGEIPKRLFMIAKYLISLEGSFIKLL